MNAELAFGLALGALVAFGRWRAYQWARTPLGQSQLAFGRARRERERQRLALEPGRTPAHWAALTIVGLAFLAWAAGSAWRGH